MFERMCILKIHFAIFCDSVKWHLSQLYKVIRLFQGNTSVPIWSPKLTLSCWTGLISGWVTGEVRLVLLCSFAHSTSSIVRELGFSRSQPDFFSGFPPSPKSTPSQKHLHGLGTVLRDHAWPFGGSLKHLPYAFDRSRLSYALRSSALGVASKSD